MNDANSLHREGYGVTRIADLNGLSYSTVRSTIDLYLAGGASALEAASRGHRADDSMPYFRQAASAIEGEFCLAEPGCWHAINRT